MCNALRNVRRWIGSNFKSSNELHHAYLVWARTEYRNDWEYHYNRLLNEAKQRRNDPEEK